MTRDAKGEIKPIQNIIQLIQHAIAFWMKCWIILNTLKICEMLNVE